MFTADALSRAVDKKVSAIIVCADIHAYVDMVVSLLLVSADRTVQIVQETNKDETLQELKETIQKGCPESKSNSPKRIQDY